MILSSEKRLRSEIFMVEQMLADVPEEAAIDRFSLLGRIESLREELSQVQPSIEPKVVKLTFRGRPVVGSRGVFADFAAKTTSLFSELVTLLAAAQSKPVSWTGPIPNRADSQVLVTGTATGSFGFEFQDHTVQQPLFDDSPVVQAFGQVQQVLSSIVADDDQLTEAIAGLDERAVTTLKKFLEALVSHDAVCRMTFREKDFGFSDVAEIRRGLDRLASDNFHEEDEKYFGVFLGVLPNRRTFEFRVSSEETVISGKIGGDIVDPAAINTRLGIPAEIKITATRLGHGRARLVLNEEPIWSAN